MPPHSPPLLRCFAPALLAGLTAIPALGQAAEPVEVPDVEPAGTDFTVAVDLTVASQYFFRGYEQQDAGLIFQPSATLGITIADGVVAYIGVWESIHSVPTPGASSPKSWYEQDLYAGLTIALSDTFELDVSYVGYFSPSDTFSDIHELDFKLTLEDENWTGEAWSFDPYILVAVEFNDNGGSEDIYLELGGAFGFDLTDTISASVPVVLGLSLDDYYTDASGDNEIFGYASIGFFVTLPLSELIDNDPWLLPWEVTAGVTCLLLNDDAGLTDNTSGNSDSFQLIGSIGLSREW